MGGTTQTKYRQAGHSLSPAQTGLSVRALRREASKDEWAVIRTGRATRGRGRVSAASQRRATSVVCACARGNVPTDVAARAAQIGLIDHRVPARPLAAGGRLTLNKLTLTFRRKPEPSGRGHPPTYLPPQTGLACRNELSGCDQNGLRNAFRGGPFGMMPEWRLHTPDRYRHRYRRLHRNIRLRGRTLLA